MRRQIPSGISANERHFSGKTTKTYIHRNLGCVHCSFISSLSPVDKLSLKELTLKILVLILLVSGQIAQTLHLLSIDYMASVNIAILFRLLTT